MSLPNKPQLKYSLKKAFILQSNFLEHSARGRKKRKERSGVDRVRNIVLLRELHKTAQNYAQNYFEDTSHRLLFFLSSLIADERHLLY